MSMTTCKKLPKKKILSHHGKKELEKKRKPDVLVKTQIRPNANPDPTNAFAMVGSGFSSMLVKISG